MFGFNHWELIIVAVIALLLFGKRLPQTMGSLGRSIVEFKKGIKGIEEEPVGESHASEAAKPAQAPSQSAQV